MDVLKLGWERVKNRGFTNCTLGDVTITSSLGQAEGQTSSHAEEEAL